MSHRTTLMFGEPAQRHKVSDKLSSNTYRWHRLGYLLIHKPLFGWLSHSYARNSMIFVLSKHLKKKKLNVPHFDKVYIIICPYKIMWP